MIRYFNGLVLLPILEKISKRQVFPKLAELREFDKLPYPEQLRKQRQGMYEMLLYCKSNVPYYRKIMQEVGFDVEKIKDDSNYIQKLPVLAKDLVREHSDQLKAQDGRFLHTRKTGGSTGQSVFFYYDNEGLDWTAAMNIYSHEMAGRKLYHTDLQIGADLDFGTPAFKDRMRLKIRFAAQNRRALPVSSFSEEFIEKNYQAFKKYRPYLIQGHPSSLYAIADYIERKNLKRVKLCEVFEPTGEMLTPKMVELIEKNILCRVANRYGNAEFGVIAHSRKSDPYYKLRVFQQAFYAEPCESSSIIVTAFTNYGFPLLRYDTGDVATIKSEADGMYIYDIQGRVHDTFTVEGKVFPTHYVMDYLDHKVRGVREFQVVLTDEQSLPQLNVVAEDINDKDRIISVLREKWPSGLDINFVEYDSLKLQGWRQKFRHLIDLRGKK